MFVFCTFALSNAVPTVVCSMNKLEINKLHTNFGSSRVPIQTNSSPLLANLDCLQMNPSLGCLAHKWGDTVNIFNVHQGRFVPESTNEASTSLPTSRGSEHVSHRVTTMSSSLVGIGNYTCQ